MSIPDIHIPGLELIRALPQRGPGIVFEARQTSLNRTVAVKILPAEWARDVNLVNHFQGVARTLATLKHENIVQVYQAGMAGEAYYCITEWVAGYSVADLVERKRFITSDDAHLIAESVAYALDYAWRTTMLVHGNLKPSNILIDADGTIRITDFLAPGLTSHAETARTYEKYLPNYLAPENFFDEVKQDCRSDIFSLGCLLYHSLSGKMPYGDAKDRGFQQRKLTDTLEDVMVLNPGVPSRWAWFIEKTLSREATNRPANWPHFLDDLKRVNDGLFPKPPLPRRGNSCMGRASNRSKKPDPEHPPSKHSSPGLLGEQDLVPEKKQLSGILLFLLLIPPFAILGVIFWLLVSPDKTPPDLEPGLEPALTQPAHPLEEEPNPPKVMESKAPLLEDEMVEEPLKEEDEPQREEVLEKDAPEQIMAERPTTTWDPQRAANLKEYVNHMKDILVHSRAWDVESAQAALSSWGDAHRDQQKTESQRMQRLADVLNTIESEQTRLRKVEIEPRPGIQGTVKSISKGLIKLQRRTEAGEALYDVPLISLPDKDLLSLLNAMDPKNSDTYMAILTLARGRIEAASEYISRANGKRQEELETWQKDWAQVRENGRAFRVLDLVEKRIEEEDIEKLIPLVDKIDIIYATSDVALWAGGPLLDAARKACVPEEEEETEPVYEPIDDEDFFQADAPQILFIQSDTIKKLSIDKLKNHLDDYDSEVVRLRPRYRGATTKTPSGKYSCVVWDEKGWIAVVFPSEGLDWVTSISTSSTTGGRRDLYGTVDAEAENVILSGRKTRPSDAPGVVSIHW